MVAGLTGSKSTFATGIFQRGRIQYQRSTKVVPNPDPGEGTRLQDAGMRVKALSRWNNYYVAGIQRIMKDFGADGVYLDEIAYDRITMLRARKVLGDAGRIDHHADHGFVSSSPVMNYMELYPFINRLWYESNAARLCRDTL
jgi:hypothetical protein